MVKELKNLLHLFLLHLINNERITGHRNILITGRPSQNIGAFPIIVQKLVAGQLGAVCVQVQAHEVYFPVVA
jgi:hypothetical protein